MNRSRTIVDVLAMIVLVFVLWFVMKPDNRAQTISEIGQKVETLTTNAKTMQDALDLHNQIENWRLKQEQSPRTFPLWHPERVWVGFRAY